MIIIQPDRTLRNPEEKDRSIEVVYSLVPYLDEYIEIHEDVTLGDFFKFIKREEDFFARVFLSQLGGHDLKSYLNEVEKEVVEPTSDNISIDYLELSWVTEHDKFDNEIEFDIYFH